MPKKDNDPTLNFVRELTEHQASLRTFMGYLLGGRSDSADDLVQEVNILLWQKREVYQPDTNFRAWAFATARFVVMSHHRRLKREGRMIFDPELIDRLADEWQQEPDDREIKISAVENCVQKLPDADQELIRTRYSGHGAVEKFSETDERTAGNLRLRLFRLRAAIKQCVQQELKAEAQLS